VYQYLHCPAHQMMQGSLLEVANSLFVDFSLPKSASSALTMNDMVEYHRVVSWCSEVCDRIRSRSVASSVSSHQVCHFNAPTPTFSSRFECGYSYLWQVCSLIQHVVMDILPHPRRDPLSLSPESLPCVPLCITALESIAC
jgi:hypothetical protein